MPPSRASPSGHERGHLMVMDGVGLEGLCLGLLTACHCHCRPCSVHHLVGCLF